MKNSKPLKSANYPARFILWGIPVLFVAGGFMHFLYDLTGKLPIAGVFAPVNESVWEHLKMAFWPMLLWWLAGNFFLKRNQPVSLSKWSFSCVVAEYVCPLTVVFLFYTYTGALGFESVVVDILLLLFGITVGQLLALHIYRRLAVKSASSILAISLGLLFLLAVVFSLFTFYPPDLPLFLDTSTGAN